MLVRKNDRREIRRALRLHCRVVVPYGKAIIADTSYDLSPEGMLVRAIEPLSVGDEVEVAFRATDLGIWFDTEAHIARIVHGRRPGDHGKCYGLRFDSLSAVQRLILRGHYRRVPPPLPKRVQRIDYAATVGKIISAPRTLDYEHTLPGIGP
jgi:hypothetical protein